MIEGKRAAPRRAAKKPTRKRVRLNTDVRREQILDASVLMFSSVPYDQANLDELAAKMGISKGLIFHYFPHKRALYTAALKVECERLLEATEVKAPEVPGGAVAPAQVFGSIAGAVQIYFSYIGARHHAFVYLLRGGAESDPEISEVMQSMRSRFASRIAGSAQEVGLKLDYENPVHKMALRAWVGMLEAATIDWLQNEHRHTEAVISYAVKMLWETAMFALQYKPPATANA